MKSSTAEDRLSTIAMQTIDIDESGSMPPETQPTLRLLHSGDEGLITRAVKVLCPGKTELGREIKSPEGIELQHDRCASRVHAIVETPPEGTPIRIIDNGSRNGTFVNGTRITECVLEDNDVIRVGNSFLLLRHTPITRVDAEVPGLLGCAPSIQKLRHAIVQVAGRGATLLLLGESGTGKEVVAQALHKLSGRKGPLIAVNCAAIAESLAESQLFGHIPGAFTGARVAQEGYFRSAHGGTLFLDELGEMPLPLQAKLLRVLEERQVTPVGSTRPVSVDVFLIAATNRNLIVGVGAGTFRGDLYARLAQVVLRLPPLRARREDILPLLMYFLGEPVPRLTPALAEALLLHPWPFNVRELAQLASLLKVHREGATELDLPVVEEHLSQHANVPAELPRPRSSSQPDVLVNAAPLWPTPKPSEQSSKPDKDKEKLRPSAPMKEELVQLLEQHQGNISELARHYGRSRRQIDRWIEQYGLKRKEFLP